ncbi:MAG: class I SAM-dependent methyltransferase [Proteobacteria bacterium]|nr:class I SAM-dependent methyltransferase [Pseudomonadota bacterium]MDA1059836.1 class I SAM-dependent methyltransferase [Pseudomonadota bacterium]
MDPNIKTVIAELDGRIAKERERMSSGGSFNPDDFALAAGPHSAGLLNLLIRTSNAQSIVEVGTSIGYTALWLGEAARATGGRVVGMEKIDSKHTQALDNLKRAGLDDIVEVRKGDAKEIVKAIDGPIDVAFLDAWKDDYFDYFDTLLPKMRVGGCIVADNITFPESVQELMKRYQAHVRAKPNVRSHFLSVGSGLEMSVKTGD